MKRALAVTPSVYREFISTTVEQPMGGLFELNVYATLDDAFPGAVPQPRLPGSAKRGDVLICVLGRDVFVEATVIGKGQFWNGVADLMQREGTSHYGTSGPGPEEEARRIAAKIAEELKQTATDAANVLCLSFFDTSPSELARRNAFEDLLVSGGRYYGQLRDGTPLDLSNLNRVDSVFEFARDRLRQVHVNQNAVAASRLAAHERDAIRTTFTARPLMIR